MFKQIDHLHQQLQQLRHQNQIPSDTQNRILDKWRVEWTYHSNAIEGNQLTLLETRVVLESGITIGGKPLIDHLEAIDHKEAILFVEKLSQQKTELNEHQLKQIHTIVLKRIRPDDAGRYRQVPVVVGDHLPPQPWEVPIQMEHIH